MKILPVILVLLTTSALIGGEPQGGFVLMGGGDTNEAFKWMAERSGSGSFIVLASTQKYNTLLSDIGIGSVETLDVDTKELANSDEIVQKIEAAGAIFIGGGNQADYLEAWQGTKLLIALNAKIGKIPIGGVSAGMALLGEFFYGAKPEPCENASSTECLLDPFSEGIGVLGRGFLNSNILKGIVTDTHYSERQRYGRHVTFMARLSKEFALAEVKGIGVDQDTALCIDSDGTAQVYGSGKTYFLKATSKPMTCTRKTPLNWGKPIEVQIVGNGGNFSVGSWTGSGKFEKWHIENGQLTRQ